MKHPYDQLMDTAVFRELLQNSDDAASQAVEIHFQTQAFIDNKSGKATDKTEERLPELKTAQVRNMLSTLMSFS